MLHHKALADIGSGCCVTAVIGSIFNGDYFHVFLLYVGMVITSYLLSKPIEWVLDKIQK